MSDFLLDLGANATTRKLVRAVGLPIPLPQKLERTDGPWRSRPLEGRRIEVGGAGGLAEVLGRCLAGAGAEVAPSGDPTPWRLAAEAYSRPLAPPVPDGEEAPRCYGLLFDATQFEDPADLRAL